MCYVALRILGAGANSKEMINARAFLHSHGGEHLHQLLGQVISVSAGHHTLGETPPCPPGVAAASGLGALLSRTDVVPRPHGLPARGIPLQIPLRLRDEIDKYLPVAPGMRIAKNRLSLYETWWPLGGFKNALHGAGLLLHRVRARPRSIPTRGRCLPSTALGGCRPLADVSYGRRARNFAVEGVRLGPKGAGR